jgi:hypothetical protein
LTGNAAPEGDEQAEAEAPPEEEVAEPRLHRARHEQDEAVIDHLHHGDRDRVCGERDAGCPAKRYAAGDERA